jgi:phage tail protein X
MRYLVTEQDLTVDELSHRFYKSERVTEILTANPGLSKEPFIPVGRSVFLPETPSTPSIKIQRNLWQ